MAAKKRGLGRGLDALLAGTRPAPAANTDDITEHESETKSLDGQLKELPVEFIQRGKYQPRRDMHPEALDSQYLAVTDTPQGRKEI